MKIFPSDKSFTFFQSSEKGFTLMELILIITLLGIMAAIAVPTISSWAPIYRHKSAARNLYLHLQKARSEAAKRNVTVNFNFTAATGTQCQDESFEFKSGSGESLMKYHVGKGFRISKPAAGKFPEGFQMNGLPVDTSIEPVPKWEIDILPCGGNRPYRVTQTKAGGLILEQP